MEEIGVQLLVEGLDSFVGNMEKAKGSLLDMVAAPSLLQDAFGALSGALGNFASWVGDVLTFTLGGLLKDAIEGVGKAIGEMVNKTIEAGKEFQTLKIRLNGMNLQTLIDSGMEYNEAMTQSVKTTQEQLDWLQKLAAATPFDNKDISNIYTLARGYGFADEEARTLVQSLSDFTAGMGLTDVEMKRIVINLGQMQAAGKITGRELTDMARGSFVPVNAIMDRVADGMGITTDELNKLRLAGEKIDPMLFTKAFEAMVTEEPRFQGAAQRMARTFGAATDNVMDLATSFGGLNIAAPILDEIGGKIADFMDQFISTDEAGQSFTNLGQRLLDASISIGKSLVSIIDNVLGLLPPSEDLANGLVSGLETFALWLETNNPIIVDAIKSIYDWIMNLGQSDFFKEGGIISKLQELWDQLFKVNDETGKNGFQKLAEAIGKVGVSIGKVVDPFLKPLGIEVGKVNPNVNALVDGLTKFSEWIDKNQNLLRILLGAFIAFQIIQTITNLVFGFIVSLAGLAVVITGVLIGAGILVAGFVSISIAIVTVTSILFLLQVAFLAWRAIADFVINAVILFFFNLVRNAQDALQQIKDAFNRGDWVGMIQGVINLMTAGWNAAIQSFIDAVKAAGANAVLGFRDGFFSQWTALLDAIGGSFQALVDFIKDLLGLNTPDELFAAGEGMALGVAKGIREATGEAVAAMSEMVAAVSMPAMSVSPTVMQQYGQMAPSAISTTYQNTTHMNLAIHSNARSEDVAANFGMMASLAGV